MLLRAALGFFALHRGGIDLAASPGMFGATWIAGALAVAAGISLLIGILTPLAAVLVGILTIGMWSSWLTTSEPNNTTTSLLFVAAVAASVAFLGPGAFSLDARLFGWREIIIPPRCSPEISEQARE